MYSSAPVLLVLGSGPGIGSHVAKAFAQKQYFSKIVLLSRNERRLNAEREEVRKHAGRDCEVLALPTDLTDFNGLRKTLKEVEKLGQLACVFFNAARIQPSQILTTPVEEIDEDFQTTNLALYITAQWAVPLLQNSGQHSASFFVTSSALPEHPLPFLSSLSLIKASQQNMVMALHEAFGRDIHFVVIKIAGQVSPDAPRLNPTSIAEIIADLYGQPEGKRELLLTVQE